LTNLYDKLIGIPWFRPERYDAARARMADADRLPPTYDLWCEGAEKREQQVSREGSASRRVNVDDDRFVGFCAGRGYLLDSKARTRFALADTAHHTKANVTDYDHMWFRHGAKR
jgi:hypothetical protein